MTDFSVRQGVSTTERAQLYAAFPTVAPADLEAVITPVEAFTVPFTFSLIGDYVKEILEVLEGALTPELLSFYIAFIRENPLYWQRTKGWVASYWNVYYRWRGVRHFRYYVGARVLAHLQQACRLAGITNK